MLTKKRAAKAVERAFSCFEIKGIDEEKRIIEGLATTPDVDRVDDVVEPMGAEFKLPLPLLLNHDHNMPVGEVFSAKKTKDGIYFKARVASYDEPGRVKDRLDEAWHSLKAGLIKAVSIGFRSLEHSIMESGGYKFLRWSWHELSLVAIPANPNASISAIKSFDRELRAASGTSQSTDNTPARVRASKKLKPRTDEGAKPMSTISEQISALEADESNLIKALKKFDVENMDEADEERFDDIEADLADTRKKLKRLRVIERVDTTEVEKAAPVEGKNSKEAADNRSKSQPGRYSARPVEAPKGINFARYVKCLVNGNGSGEMAAMLAEKHYDDRRIANFARLQENKAATPAAYTGDSGGWAEGIAEANTVGTDFIEFLRPMTIVDRLQGFRRVPFNVKVPRMTTGQSGYWVGEALPTPMTTGVFDTVTMGKTKVGSISALSIEQMRFSHINAEATIRDDLAAGVVARLDTSFISTDAAVANVSPAGLLNGLSAISSAGDTADNVRTDLVNLYEPFSTANISRGTLSYVSTENIGYALSVMRSTLGVQEFSGMANDLGSQTLDARPFLSSNHVGGGDLIAISTRDILLADDGEVEVSMSREASLEMLDGSLSQDGTDGTGASLVNLWQAGLVGIKVERFINWQKARSAAVAYIGDATYQGAATA